MHLLCSASAIGDFPTVHRVFQNSPDKSRIEQRIFSVLPLDFVNSMLIKIFGKTICAHIGMHILIEDHPNGSCFFLVDKKLPLFQFIAIRRKSTVPFALTSFLDSALHCLNTDVLTLDFGNR